MQITYFPPMKLEVVNFTLLAGELIFYKWSFLTITRKAEICGARWMIRSNLVKFQNDDSFSSKIIQILSFLPMKHVVVNFTLQ